MLRTTLRGAFCLLLLFHTTGCASVAKGLGKAIAMAVVTTAVYAVTHPGPHGHHAREQPVDEAEEPSPPLPQTACERRRERWIEVHQTEAPPAYQCGPSGEDPQDTAYAAPL